MTISTYTELQTAITNWIVRTDLTDRYPEWIANAESRFNRDLRVRDMETSSTLTLASGSVALPSTYLEWINVLWAGSSRTQDLMYVEPDSEQWRYRYRPSEDPTMFTILAGSIYTRPSGGSQDITLSFYRTIPDLATNSTNWLLTKAPNLYLFASLMEECIFVQDDERAAKFFELVTNDIASLNAEADSNKLGRRGTYDAAIQERSVARTPAAGAV